VFFFAALILMGWSVALGCTSLILRYGAGAESLAWSVLFGIAPFAAVFYPVSVLPAWLQPVALALPAAHVFEGMRAALMENRIAWGHLAAARGRRSRRLHRSSIGTSRRLSGSRAPGRTTGEHGAWSSLGGWHARRWVRSCRCRARAGGAVRRSETFIIPIASCLQGTILAPIPARPPRPAAWLTAIRHFG
jgi:hypothetical protein